MSAETAIIISFGFAFVGLAWYGFRMMDSEQPFIGILGTIFVSLALALLQVIVWSGLEIARVASYTNIVSGTTEPVLWIVMLSVFLFWLSLLFKSLIQLTLYIIDYFSHKFGRDDDAL